MRWWRAAQVPSRLPLLRSIKQREIHLQMLRNNSLKKSNPLTATMSSVRLPRLYHFCAETWRLKQTCFPQPCPLAVKRLEPRRGPQRKIKSLRSKPGGCTIVPKNIISTTRTHTCASTSIEPKGQREKSMQTGLYEMVREKIENEEIKNQKQKHKTQTSVSTGNNQTLKQYWTWWDLIYSPCIDPASFIYLPWPSWSVPNNAKYSLNRNKIRCISQQTCCLNIKRHIQNRSNTRRRRRSYRTFILYTMVYVKFSEILRNKRNNYLIWKLLINEKLSLMKWSAASGFYEFGSYNLKYDW